MPYSEQKCPIGCKMAFWSPFPSLGADGLYRKWGMDMEHFEGNSSLRVSHIYLWFVSWILRAAETNWGCSDSHLGQNSPSLQHRLKLSVPIFFFQQVIPTKGQKEEQGRRSNWKKQLPVVYNLKAYRYRGSPKWKKCVSGNKSGEKMAVPQPAMEAMQGVLAKDFLLKKFMTWN